MNKSLPKRKTVLLDSVISDAEKLTSFERTILYRRLLGIYPRKKDHSGRKYLLSKGRYGSCKQPTWNGEIHICCGSGSSGYHRKKCDFCISNNVDDLSDLKDII